MQQIADESIIQSLRHVLLKAREPSSETASDYDKAYAFWLEMWRSTFAEVDPELTLRSDTFVTQREVSAVFSGDQVVGLMMYDFRDLRLQAHRDLSALRHYPAQVLDDLTRKSQGRIMLMGQLTVHPNWRKNKVGPLMSDLLVGLSVKRFLASSYDVMIAFTRNDRGTQELGYRFGAVPLHRGHEAYGIASDVIAFHRDRVVNSPTPRIAQLVELLWHDTGVARLFSELPPAMNKGSAENDTVVLLNESQTRLVQNR